MELFENRNIPQKRLLLFPSSISSTKRQGETIFNAFPRRLVTFAGVVWTDSDEDGDRRGDGTTSNSPVSDIFTQKYE